jgi:hypothetical protein
LFVKGQGSFSHRDENGLVKVAEAKPNPWLQILAAREAQAAE